jgi:sec-independent protein translocase protein TatC
MPVEKNKEMPFWDHIEELRKRLFIALVALIIATLISFSFTEKAIDILTEPVGGVTALQSIEVTENIGVFMRVSLLCGVILALPVILYEILAFIVPGLKPNERRWIFIGLSVGTVFFVIGILFAFKVLLPNALQFLISFMEVQTIPRFSSYIKFVTTLLFWIGVSFEMPLIMAILAKVGVVNAGMLLKYWRYAVIVIAVVSAVITPTVDPVNMGLLMVPLIGLYFISILFAFFAQRKDKAGKEKN